MLNSWDECYPNAWNVVWIYRSLQQVGHHKMHRLNLTAMHRKAAQNLEDSLRHFDDSPSGLAGEFVDLKLQSCIFQYDVCVEMINFIRNNPTGFAASVSLKGLVLRLYEYDTFLNTSFIPRLISLANERGIPFDQANVKRARVEWKEELRKLRSWSNVRNQAAGHYGNKLRIQITLLRDLDPDEVIGVANAFLNFNMALLVGLRDVGKGVRQQA